MAVLKFALAQFDFPVGAVARNGERVRELMQQARVAGAQLIAFPELTLSGYPPEDLLLRPSFLAACERELTEVAKVADGIAAFVGHPHAMGEVYNAASLLAAGKMQFTAHKQALPNYTVFDEKRYFRPGHDSAVADLSGVSVGWLVCEDIWEPEPAARAASKGAELLVVINASPFDVGKSAQRDELLARRARENHVAIAYLNLVGGQDDLVFDGGSLLVEPGGRIAARASAFADALLLAEYDSATRKFRAIDWPVEADASREARAYAAIVRGIADYVGKNRFPGVILGLSGGIDSALTLALAADALGADKVTAVRLPSRYTSGLSNDLAAEQAQALGVELLTIPIAAPFAGFLDALAPAFAGRASDVTEENLQSRCRGTILMALSNKTGRMLLTTGNKSEYATGYATIYGDMCGGYAPLKDCYKELVYALSRWRNRNAEVIPIAVIERAPSAELRENQRDEDSLPPYATLDAILERFIEDEQSQAEIIAAGFDEATVRRVARLVLASEYKRRQAAPGPKISTRAFGRDRRYPISSGWR
ncbi:MAG: NAD+ synthase [Xanthomonadales bacterium PRO7]|jgi:NAD+ synthase (glutamine-hydrolysing)|nr:NAD+ synthase [Xanthomonadales bacterium PRO7]HMM58338.1 NAD+ synthase [Rudaea sp.]